MYPAKHFVLPEERIEGAVDGDPPASWTSGWKSDQNAAASCSKPSGSSARTRFDIEMLHGTRLLPGHRELQPAAVGSTGRLDPQHAVQLSSPNDFLDVRRRVARHRPAGPRRCSPATFQPQGVRSSSTASAFLARSTTARSSSTSGKQKINHVVLRLGHARPVSSLRTDRRRSSSQQVIRPTGLLDPEIDSPSPARGQVPAPGAGRFKRAGTAARPARPGHDADQASRRGSRRHYLERTKHQAANGCTANWMLLNASSMLRELRAGAVRLSWSA